MFASMAQSPDSAERRLGYVYEPAIGPSMMSQLAIALLMALMAPVGTAAQLDEYQVKAAFLFNFAKFVEWPSETFKGPNDPITICVAGENPFGSALENAVKGKSVGTRGFIIRMSPTGQNVKGCQILFAALSDRRRIRALLDAVKGSSTLTVGESENFATDGGIVNFKLDGDRVRIEINAKAAEQEKLQISSKLLSLAQIVKP